MDKNPVEWASYPWMTGKMKLSQNLFRIGICLEELFEKRPDFGLFANRPYANAR